MNKYENDLTHIRQMMERSSTFVSLSGLSGIGAGVIALIGCACVFTILVHNNIDYFDGLPNFYSTGTIIQLGLVAGATLVASIISGTYFTIRKSKKLEVPLWTSASKNILISLLIPLVVGGLFCIILSYHHFFYLVAPCMLIFYGLALVSASKYTHQEIFWLGVCELFLGILAAIFLGYGLVFWALGFGVLHIVYGVVMYKKYK